MSRVYLDWNATAPLRPEARAAMIAAMDVVGNPSSVHAEGRVAKGIVERARTQVAALLGCKPNQVVFTGSATEAAALAVAQKGKYGGRFAALGSEHDCFTDWSDADLPAMHGRDGGFNGAEFYRVMNWLLEPLDDRWEASRSKWHCLPCQLRMAKPASCRRKKMSFATIMSTRPVREQYLTQLYATSRRWPVKPQSSMAKGARPI